jgi:DNA-binding CsgD family transcriptional regulator
MPPPLLVGRERELDVLLDLLRHVGARGGALVVRGEAGIGKTALLEFAERSADDLGIRVLRTAGAPAETHMAFAGLHRLLRPRLDAAAALPAPQREALAAAFGLGDGAASGTPPDLFLIALAALDVLSDAAAQAPLLVLVEDAHWLDAPTAEVLSFVARRVQVEPVLLLFAVRDGYAAGLDEARLPELRLEGLDDADAERLLDLGAHRLAPAARRRLLDAAAGNPLALVELPRARDLDGAAVGHAPVAVTERLERAFAERLPSLPGPTGRLLLVAALDEGGGLDRQLRAAGDLAGRAVSLAHLAPAEAAGLVSLDGTALRFRHPLVGAAIASTATAAERHAAHAALADAHEHDFERSVWHRAASRSGPDDAVASDLEEVARRALQRGAAAVAAEALERAAQLSAAASRRGELLVRAAELEFELGRAERALALTARARPLELEPGVRARLTFLLEAVDEVSWAGAERVAAFARLASEMTSAHDPGRALKALLAAGLRCWWGNPAQETRDLVVAAAERIPVPDDDPALVAVLSFTDPVRCGRTVIERISRMAPDANAGPEVMQLVGTAATAVWAFDRSAAFLDTAVDGLRAQGRLGLLVQALVSQAWAALHLAMPTLAASAAEEAARLAPETGQWRWGLAAQVALATVAGERGEHERAEALAQEAEAVLLPMGRQPMLALVRFARGRTAVAHGRYDDGYDQLRCVLTPSDVAYHPFVGVWALPDLIEAAVCTGRTKEALRWLGELESIAARTTSTYARAGASYARTVAASDSGDAEPLFLDALDRELTSWTCFRARLLLGYGRWLRRQRRVVESRTPLRAARESFDALGFSGLSEIARRELRASGETSVRRTPDARDRLTAQELQIAEMAASGLTNREIGQKLYLSHRTVESHLYRIFPKLGITSRSQVRAALPDSR